MSVSNATVFGVYMVAVMPVKLYMYLIVINKINSYNEKENYIGNTIVYSIKTMYT
jgi:hypothetical protein